jgi:hypothetical protein
MTSGPMMPGQLRQPVEPPPDRPGGRMPMLLSVMAVVLALVAAGVSLVALSRTGDRPAAAAATSAAPVPSSAGPPVDPTPTGALPSDATDVTTPTPEPTSEPTDGPDPAGTYTVAYPPTPLRLQPSDRYVDLDLPSANARPDRSEFRYPALYDPPKLLFGSLPVAKLTTPTGTASDCVKQLNQAPINGDFAPAKGDLICVLTSADDADRQGISRKVAQVRVDAIAPDGTLNVTVTAWNVPH